MKVVPNLISFTSIYYLQKFEFGNASFGPFQNCVCLKKWLIKKPRCSYWVEPTAAAARTPNSPLLRAAGTRLATTSVVPGRCRPPVPLPCSSTWHPPPPHTGPSLSLPHAMSAPSLSVFLTSTKKSPALHPFKFFSLPGNSSPFTSTPPADFPLFL
jgi:hypothetical protein